MKPYNRTFIVNLTLSTALLFITIDSKAGIFKCENIDGSTFYNDKPCSVKAKETTFNSIKDPKHGYIPPKLTAESKKLKNKVTVLTGEEKFANKENETSKDKANKNNTKSLNNSAGDNVSNKKESNDSLGNTFSNNDSKIGVKPIKLKEISKNLTPTRNTKDNVVVH